MCKCDVCTDGTGLSCHFLSGALCHTQLEWAATQELSMLVSHVGQNQITNVRRLCSVYSPADAGPSTSSRQQRPQLLAPQPAAGGPLAADAAAHGGASLSPTFNTVATHFPQQQHQQAAGALKGGAQAVAAAALMATLVASTGSGGGGPGAGGGIGGVDQAAAAGNLGKGEEKQVAKKG